MLFLHVPTPFTFFGMTSGAVQRKQQSGMIRDLKELFLILENTFIQDQMY